jgi:hypothetical protein
MPINAPRLESSECVNRHDSADGYSHAVLRFFAQMMILQAVAQQHSQEHSVEDWKQDDGG